MAFTILRVPTVLKMRGRSHSAHYLDIQKGLFTRPVSIGARAVGWPDYEVDTLNAARVAGLPDHEIKKLVVELEAARKVAIFASQPGQLAKNHAAQSSSDDLQSAEEQKAHS